MILDYLILLYAPMGQMCRPLLLPAAPESIQKTAVRPKEYRAHGIIPYLVWDLQGFRLFLTESTDGTLLLRNIL